MSRRCYRRYVLLAVLGFAAVYLTKNISVSPSNFPPGEVLLNNIRLPSISSSEMLDSQFVTKETISVIRPRRNLSVLNQKYRNQYYQSTYPYINCKAIIDGDKNEIAKAKAIMKIPANSFISDETYLNLTKDCAMYKKSRGFIDETFSEAYSFPIAYSILMYQEVEQTERLLRAIYRPNNVYCIHVDLDAPKIVHHGVDAIAKCFDNVFVVSKKESVVYAGLSRLQADLNCMSDLLQHKIKWKYLLNIPSQQFPLKTNEEIVEILKIYNGANDIEGITGKRMLESRFKFKYVYRKTNKTKKLKIFKTKIAKPPPPHNASVVKGSAYGVFSRDFVNFALTNKKALDIFNWMKEVLSPDEYLWATLNHNPVLKTPGGYAGDPNKKPWLATYALWGGKCDGKYVRGVCIFGAGDLQRLVTRKEMFANKFYLTYQPLALDCLEQWLYNRTFSDFNLDLGYYRNLPFVLQSSI